MVKSEENLWFKVVSLLIEHQQQDKVTHNQDHKDGSSIPD